jgi:hypothetical protein
MADENFFSRWSRRKVDSSQGKALPAEPEQQAEKQAPATAVRPAAPVATVTEQPLAEQPVEAKAEPQPTLEDVAALTHDSDYSAFVARGVDENVKRSALKKLFTDPHFNVMDGLDVYIEDFNKFEPIPAAMLASLNHAKALLDPLGHLEKPMMALLDSNKAVEVRAEDEAEETDTPELTASADAADHPEAPVESTEQAGDPEPQDNVALEASDDPTKSPEARS